MLPLAADRSGPRPDLARDTRGAMMVMGLFFAVLLTGFMYYVIGVGEAIVYRETMQDSADAGAFSAAVVHARGMNILVLINLVMAALLAILVALKIMMTLIIAAIAVCAALAFVTFGATLAAIPPLRIAYQGVQTVHNTLRPVIFTLLRAGNRTARIIRTAMPPAATVRAYDISTSPVYGSQIRFGFTWPLGIGRPLPTENGDFGVLCNHAGQAVGEIAGLPFRRIHQRIANWIADKVGDLAQSYSRWFCSGQGGPPSFDYSIEAAIPEASTPAITQCNRCETGCESICEQARQDEARSHPPDETRPYECPQTAAGQDEPLCAQRAQEARTVCDPRRGRRFKFVFQRATVRRFFWREAIPGTDPVQYRNRYTNDGLGDSADARQRDDIRDPRRGTSDQNPCMFVAGFNPSRWHGTDLEDLCGQDLPTWPSSILPPGQLPIGRDRAVHQDTDIIRRLFACHEERSQTLETDGERGLPSDTSDMAPSRMSRERGVELGEDRFQIRMVVIGRPPGAHMERGVALGNWGRGLTSDTSGVLGMFRRLGQFSVAQGEFYYPSERLDDREEWMWNMRWRARMRRFRPPVGDDGSSTCGSAPGGGAGVCSGLGGVMGNLRELVVH